MIDALIFVKLRDGTVHQVHLTPAETHRILEHAIYSCGGKLKLCEQAEPLNWKRETEERAGKSSAEISALHTDPLEKPKSSLLSLPRRKPPLDGEDLIVGPNGTINTKTGELKLF